MQKLVSLAVGVGFLALVACGSSKESNSNGSSRLPGNGSSVGGGGNFLLAECTRIAQANIGLSGQLSTYYDPITRQTRNDYVQLNLTTVPSGIQSGSTQYLQIFRWKDGLGGFQLNSIPVRMNFVSKITGMAVNGSPVDRISKKIISDIIQAAGLGNLGVNNSNFFDQYLVVMTGMDYDWYAISFAYYNTAVGTAAVGSAEAMLPPVIADPNTYMSLVPSNRLHMLHPNYSYRTSGANEQEFQRLSDEICTEFFSAVRYTASVKSKSLWEKFKDLWSSVTRLLHDFLSL